MGKVVVENITKVFGSNKSHALKSLEEGKSKDTILKETGATIGVNQVSFSVNEGEIFVIMGLSGSGKSTLIRIINRLIEPTQGNVYIDGTDITKIDKKELNDIRRKKLGMVFQNFGLLPHRSVVSNVAYGLEIQGVNKEDREAKAKSTLERVGLSGYENSLPNELSGGMQQRVGLARALANDSDILLMDEAFSALDPIIRNDMQDELLQLQDSIKKTILFITHDLDEALKIGDRIAIMKDGCIVQIGTSEDILTNPANDYVSNFVKDVDRSKVLTAENIMKKTDVIATWKDGPRVAIRKMEEKGISSIFVVDKEKNLKGLLTIDAALEAVKKNKWVEEMLITDYCTTQLDTPLSDLIPIAAETKYPIAVVKNDKLLGIIVRVSILSGLVLGKENGEEVSN